MNDAAIAAGLSDYGVIGKQALNARTEASVRDPGYSKAANAATGQRRGRRLRATLSRAERDGARRWFGPLLQSREEQQAFFQKVADGYYREGYRGGGPFTNLDVVAIGTRSALATMDWELLSEDKTMIRRWRQSYNLLRVGTEWRVLASTFHQ